MELLRTSDTLTGKCYQCNESIGNFQDAYYQYLQEGKSRFEALELLGFHREMTCCRRSFLSHVIKTKVPIIIPEILSNKLIREVALKHPPKSYLVSWQNTVYEPDPFLVFFLIWMQIRMPDTLLEYEDVQPKLPSCSDSLVVIENKDRFSLCFYDNTKDFMLAKRSIPNPPQYVFYTSGFEKLKGATSKSVPYPNEDFIWATYLACQFMVKTTGIDNIHNIGDEKQIKIPLRLSVTKLWLSIANHLFILSKSVSSIERTHGERRYIVIEDWNKFTQILVQSPSTWVREAIVDVATCLVE
jgi:DNA-directed RNA polymerase subunit N (RpoN/RPB10)